MYKRHKIFWKVIHPIAVLFLKIRFGYTYKKAEGLPDKYIVLSNHTTDYDPLFVASSFKEQMYYVASEHVARWGFLSKLLTYWLAPIVRYKGTTATITVMEMLRKIREGASVCMFAEGARSWDGVTDKFLPSTGKVVKSAKCGLVTYRIEGGYFVSPRWSASLRRGRVHGAPVNVYTKEQLAKMSVEEINAAIARDLHEDAYERQLANPVSYKGKNIAEGMENLLFICPKCGAMDSFHSEGDAVSCSACDLKFRYTEYGMLEGAPFKTVYDFAKWQKEEARKLVANNNVIQAQKGTLKTVVNHVEEMVDEGMVSMDTDGITVGNTTISMDQILDLNMFGKRGIVFSTKETYYELKPEKGTCAYKFHLYFDLYKEK